MKIEEGKYYRRADGKKVGPAAFRGGDEKHPWMVNAPWNSEHLYTEDGKSHIGDGRRDLIAEWTDRPPLNTYIEWDGSEECPVPNGSEVTTWVGDAPEFSRHPKSIDWRVITAYLVHSYPPEEERVECARGVTWEEFEHGTCIIRNGEVDWSTWQVKQ